MKRIINKKNIIILVVLIITTGIITVNAENIIILVVLIITTGIITVNAENIIELIDSSRIKYGNNGKETVKEALDDLMSKAGKCPNDKICINEWPWQPKYFSFDTQINSNYTDYHNIKYYDNNPAKVFIASDDDGNKGVCIIRNDKLHCFKQNNFDNEKLHVSNVFSDIECNNDTYPVSCYAQDFGCYVTPNNYVYCYHQTDSAKYACDLENGNFNCTVTNN